jgi:DNA-binding LytR/AlgR family response regulator
MLIVDDSRAVHEDIRKILNSYLPAEGTSSLEDMEADLFGAPRPRTLDVPFDIVSAFQGKEGLERVEEAVAAGTPYAVAFVDVRMPPGWDGVETIRRMWLVDPCLQVILCTAYSDHSWGEIASMLGRSANMLVLKKPFDNIEVSQMAHVLSEKWVARREVERQIRDLQGILAERTRELSVLAERLRQATPAPIALARK